MTKRSRRIKQEMINEIMRNYNYSCAICNWGLDITRIKKGRGLNQRGLDIHHIIPFSENGENTLDNLILLCPNHHKEADLGLISADYLRAHLKTEQLDNIKWLKYNYKINR